jgi:hypothetical protein
MRKRTWVEVGIAVLALVLVCGAAPGVAQTQDPYGMGTGTPDTGTAGTYTPGSTVTEPQPSTADDTGQVTSSPATVDTGTRQELTRLRAQVAQLQLQLDQMRVRLAQAQQQQQQQRTAGSTQGVGGGGSAGIGDPNAEAPAGATGIGTPQDIGGRGSAGPPARTDQATSNPGVALASVIHTGRVRSVSAERLVLEEEGGGSNTLSLARDVQVFRGGNQVTLKSVGEGALVRTSADLYARGNPVTRIDVLPPR